MGLNRNNLSVIGLVGMILTASFFVHGPMILPSFGPQKQGKFNKVYCNALFLRIKSIIDSKY